MSLFQIIKEKKVALPLTKIEINYIAKTVFKVSKTKGGDFSIVLVTDAKIKKLNLAYRKKDKVTDILSFPADDELGDLILAPDHIKKEAKKDKNSIKKHYTILLIHGLLHLLGHDHIVDKDFVRMKKLEDKVYSLVYKKLNLQINSYETF